MKKKTQKKQSPHKMPEENVSPSPQELLDELLKSPKEKANNLVHLISYMRSNVGVLMVRRVSCSMQRLSQSSSKSVVFLEKHMLHVCIYKHIELI